MLRRTTTFACDSKLMLRYFVVHSEIEVSEAAPSALEQPAT
jgi:hypothetical protein